MRLTSALWFGFAGVLFSYMALGASAADPHEVTLADHGRARMAIVIHRDASRTIRDTADELSRFLGQITGARFDVTTGSARRGIVLGTIAQFPIADLREPLAMDGPYDGKEAYAIRTEPGRVLLLGGDDLGASHAAYAFLEHLGCRWFFPSESWHIIPSHSTLTAALDEQDRPAMLSRRIWWGFGLFDERAREDYDAWSRRNRMAASLKIRSRHAYQSIIRHNAELLEEHPEYLALVDGERQGPQLCLSNPGTQQMVVDYVLEQLEKNPDRDMESVDPSDGANHCECEACEAIGSVSDRVFGMANVAARAVQEHFPGKMVGLYAYNEHSDVPDFELEPNVYVQLTAGFIRGQRTFDELLDLWPEKTHNIGFYEYFSVFQWDWDMLPGGRAANVHDLRERIRRYAARDATSLDAESSNNWGLHGRGYYVANRLMWDPEADLDALLDDFHTKAFGPAAEVMARYYERVDPANDPLVSDHLLALVFRDIEEAWELSDDHPDVRRRLAELIWYLRYVHLRWEFDNSGDPEHKADLAREMLTLMYRSRYAYMNHWLAFRNWQSHRWAEEFDDPSLNARQSEVPHSFAVEEPISLDETEAMLKEGLERFQPEDVEQIQFSADLVPVDFKRHERSNTRHSYQRGVRYALYSLRGEPLQVQLTAGTIAHYRNRAPAHFTFFDDAGESLQEGHLPLDGEARPLTVRVPRPGLYYLEINSSSAGWRIEADEDVPVTVPLRRSRRFDHAGHMQTMYFYVPRGTRRITYFWAGHPHRVHGPDGTVLKEVEDSDRFIHVDVPAGADGEVWHFTKLRLGHMWFFNIPNYLASSPRALLVPREVAEADRLRRRTR